MNMFELFKYGPQVIFKLTIDGLQVIFKLTKLRSALIEHFSIHLLEDSNFDFRYKRLCDFDIPKENSCTFCKQWRLWSDDAFCGVWYGSALFASYPIGGLQTKMGKPIVVGTPLKGYLANSADPDQTPQKAASDQSLHCLQILQPFFSRNM